MLGSDESRESQQRALELVVADEEEGAATELVLAALYAADPGERLAGKPQQTLLKVLQVADRLQAPACVEVAAAALTAAPLEFETAMAVFALPPGCSDNPTFKPAIDAAAAAVRERLGGLGAALDDAASREQLLQLPLPALVRLLRGGATRAASENTVFWVADAWMDMHGGGSEEEQAALAGCVRIHHATSMYVPAVMGQRVWLRRHRADLQLAAAFAAGTDSLRAGFLGETDFPALQLPKRPASFLTKATLAWDVPLADIKRAFDLAVAKKGASSMWSPVLAWWGGYTCKLRLQACCSRSAGCCMGLYINPRTPPCSAAKAFAGASVRVSAGAEVLKEPCWMSITSTCRGFKDAFGLGARMEWDEVAWHNAGLVEDGKVKLRVTVKKVL